MLNFWLNISRKILNGKSGRRIRSGSYWTEIYPSPEPSWMRNTTNKAGDWIYNSIDNFFQGPASRYNADIRRNSPVQDILSSTQVEWELNQDIADIAFQDIKNCLRWIIPGFIKRYAIRLHQYSLLYLFTDVSGEEESPAWGLNSNKDRINSDQSKIVYVFQHIKVEIISDCLSIIDWWKRSIGRLKVSIKVEEEKETYYLPGYFAPKRYGYLVHSQDQMIRGPDKSKLNPAFSFHKRI